MVVYKAGWEYKTSSADSVKGINLACKTNKTKQTRTSRNKSRNTSEHYTTLWKELQMKFQHLLGKENAHVQTLKDTQGKWSEESGHHGSETTCSRWLWNNQFVAGELVEVHPAQLLISQYCPSRKGSMLHKPITKHTTEQPVIFLHIQTCNWYYSGFVAPNKLFKHSGFSLILHPTL